MKKRVIKNLIKTLFYCSSVLIGLFLILFSYWWSDYNERMLIHKIELSQTKVLQNQYYTKLVNNFKGKNLNKIDLLNIKNSLDDHPYIKAVRISKRYPSTVKIEIIDRSPIALLQINPLVLIDNEGVVLPNEGNSMTSYNLPIMTNFNPDIKLYPAGKETKSSNVRKSIFWLNTIKSHYPSLYKNVSEMKMTENNEMELILSEYPTRIYLGEKELWFRINTLKKFEQKLGQKRLSDFTYLDMRYNNQIIAKSRI